MAASNSDVQDQDQWFFLSFLKKWNSKSWVSDGRCALMKASLPFRVFFLEMTDDVAIERLTLRAIDPMTGERFVPSFTYSCSLITGIVLELLYFCFFFFYPLDITHCTSPPPVQKCKHGCGVTPTTQRLKCRRGWRSTGTMHPLCRPSTHRLYGLTLTGIHTLCLSAWRAGWWDNFPKYCQTGPKRGKFYCILSCLKILYCRKKSNLHQI